VRTKLSLSAALALALAACGGEGPTPHTPVPTPDRSSAPAPPPPTDPRLDAAGGLLEANEPFADPKGSAPPERTALARVHLVDVGQGAATLLELSCAALLVDTGGETNAEFDSGAALRSYLDAFFAKRADLKGTLSVVFLTHPHQDHAANAKELTGRYRIENVVTDGLEKGSGGPEQRALQDWARAKAKLETVTTDALGPEGLTSPVIDPVKCADVDPVIRALWGAMPTIPDGWSKKDFDNANNHSVVLRFDIGKTSMLVTGDLEEKGINALLAKYAGTRLLDVDVYEVGHHGSHNATTDALLGAMSPALALVAMGPESRHVEWSAWKYGHPRKVTIERVERAVTRRRNPRSVKIATGTQTFESHEMKQAIYGTGWDGNVIVTILADGNLRVRTSR
jgi:competence protein ComEC